MLKKYTDYINENSSMKSSTPDKETPKVQEPKVQEPMLKKTPKPKKIEKVKEISESIIFDGKVVSFIGPIKPSSTIQLLEQKKISKSKLHFIITEQNDSIVLLKYNLETKIDLNLFVETLIKYHKDNLNESIFENINIEGSDTFTIIKNIPNDDIKNIIVENIKKLLK